MEHSILDKFFFINKFNNLNKIIEEIKTIEPIINYNQNILGALSYKKYFIELLIYTKLYTNFDFHSNLIHSTI